MGHRIHARRGTRRALWVATLTAGSGIASANPQPLPSDFLEYLGSWESDDADWVVANEADPHSTVNPSQAARGPATGPATPNRTTPPTRATTTPSPQSGTERKP